MTLYRRIDVMYTCIFLFMTLPEHVLESSAVTMTWFIMVAAPTYACPEGSRPMPDDAIDPFSIQYSHADNVYSDASVILTTNGMVIR